MPLKIRDFRTRKEDISTGSTGGGLFFLEQWFRDVRGMLDHFRHESGMARPNVAENTLNDPLLQ